jgi:hypothetical protein
MSCLKGLLIVALTATTLHAAAAQPTLITSRSPILGCSDLMDITKVFSPGATITAATIVAVSGGLPEHCRVEGWRWPDDGFVIKLPTSWNSRLFQIGNGGAAGVVVEADMAIGLAGGFVTAGGSGGHRSPATLYQFGYFAGSPDAHQKIVDYCSNSVHATNQLAKRMIRAYYGVSPTYSYYLGYSSGGRQGLVEAQLYPDDFDGILGGGSPAPFTVRVMEDAWVPTQLTGASYIPHAKLNVLAEAVMAKCDGIDGLQDGLIDDPRECDFNALSDLPACRQNADAPDCFTQAQRQAVYNIYRGPVNAGGTLLAKGTSFGSEAIMADGTSGWTTFVPPTPNGLAYAARLGGSFVRWIGLPPKGGGPGWDPKTFDVNTDWEIVRESWGQSCDASEPDLRSFKIKGKKFIDYHAWADALCWPSRAIEYHEQVTKIVGSPEETNSFYKLYMIPGMTHFPGSRGVFDRNTLREPFFRALQEWAEKRKEPGAIIGTRAAVPGRWAAISRPICPYPQVSRYTGKGSSDDAANFSCVAPAK